MQDLTLARQRSDDLHPGNGVARHLAEQQIERIIADETLSRAPSLCRFLRFTVEETLEGRAGQLKEYVIGLKVFDRGASFDPRLDPIVRVQARKLRACLREYYETRGAGDPVVIEFPKGGYVPVFALAKSARTRRMNLPPGRAESARAGARA